MHCESHLLTARPTAKSAPKPTTAAPGRARWDP